MNGGKVIYSCPFVPAEWIAAHGFTPCRLMPPGPTRADAPFPVTGVCPYAAAFAAAAIGERGAAAIVMTTTCDQMRRMAEFVAEAVACRVFIMHVPTIADPVVALPMYRDEIIRLGRFLGHIGGAHASQADLAREMIAPLGPPPVCGGKAEGGKADRQIPLALVGSPLMQHDEDLLATIERAGGAVVLDATGSGERTVPRRFDYDAVQRDAMEELVNAYFAIPDAFRRPNDALYAYLKRECAARGVHGVILRHCVWCDTWQAEAYRLRQRLIEWGEIPLLVLDVAEDDHVQSRTTGRIEAFMESLR